MGEIDFEANLFSTYAPCRFWGREDQTSQNEFFFDALPHQVDERWLGALLTDNVAEAEAREDLAQPLPWRVYPQVVRA
jgi:hypothetical protein